MDQQEIKTLKLFEALEENGNQSQRELAGKLEISLGLVNYLLQKVVKEGFFQVVSANKSRLKYVLTSKGISEKFSLTRNYFIHSIIIYRDIRKRVDQLFKVMENEKVKDIVLIGATELSEIAYIILLEYDFNIVGIVDSEKAGKKFLGMNISDYQLLYKVDYDALLITLLNSKPKVSDMLAEINAQGKKIYSIPPVL